MFTSMHWYIDSKNKDDDLSATNPFVTDIIQSVRILVNPPSENKSPKKRKTAQHDPNDALLNK